MRKEKEKKYKELVEKIIKIFEEENISGINKDIGKYYTMVTLTPKKSRCKECGKEF